MHKQSYRMKKSDAGETRFRGSIYVDVWVQSFSPEVYNDETDETTGRKVRPIEEMRAEAEEILKEAADEISSKIGNAYVGGVGLMTGNILHPLDREI